MKTHAKISLAVPEPATSEAGLEASELLARIDRSLQHVTEISYEILVCGPRLDPPSPAAIKRQEIFQKLEEARHKPFYSESLPRRENILPHDALMAKGQGVDLIIVLVDINVPRTVSEARDFCDAPEIRQKLLLLIPIELRDSEDGDQTLQAYDASGYVKVVWYKYEELPECRVRTESLLFVQARQSIAYRQRK